MQDDADEDNHANVVIVQKGPEATIAGATSREPQMIAHQRCGDPDRSEIPKTELCHIADRSEREQHQNLHATDDKQVGVAE